MGIGKNKTQKKNLVKLNELFIDRDEHQYNFRKHLGEVNASDFGGLLLIYSGVGRVGKSSLLKQFEIFLADKNFVRYSFESKKSDDAKVAMVSALKTLRARLTKKYKVEFPLFDKGCIYLAQKSNEFNSFEQQKVILKDSSTLQNFKVYLDSLTRKNIALSTVAKFVNNFVDDTGEVFDVLDKVADSSLAFKTMKIFIGFLDRKMTANAERARMTGDTDYAALINELKTLNEQDDGGELLKEILPKLFAKDLSHWLNTCNTNLIIFLDAYEKLTGDEQGKKNIVRLFSTNDDVPADWWVGELLAEVERVIWVIACRHKIEKIGDVDCSDSEQIKNYTVEVFDNYWAKNYLQAGGVPEEFHAGIIELTGGHPYYIRKCIETYQNYQAKNKIPTLADFGKNREDIVQATIGSLDEGGQFMAQCLCILNSWTNELAAAAIENFNNVTYHRVKRQVARAEHMNFGEVYTFDRTIDAFFFPALKNNVTCRKIFSDIRDKAAVFFQKIFAAEKNPCEIYGAEDKLYHYFVMWSEIILRTTDAPAELMTQYEKNFAPYINRLDCSTREIIVKKFSDKVDDAETLSVAYFQNQRGMIRLAQGKIKNAFELSAAAYSTVKKFSLGKADLTFKISVTTGHADVLKALKRYRDEIILREEIFGDCVHCFDKGDKRIIDAMNNLAQALENGDKLNAACELRRQALKLLDGRDDEKYIHASKAFLKILESREDLDKFWYRDNRSEELEHVRENLAARLKRRLDAYTAPDEKTVALMSILAEVTRSADWQNKLDDTIKKIVAECTAEPIADYDDAISTLKNLFSHTQQIDLARKILTLTSEKPGVDVAEIIAAKKDLASAKSIAYDRWESLFEIDAEADNLFTEVEDFFREKLPNRRKELAETLRAHAELLKKFGDHAAELKKLEEVFALLESDSDTPPAEIFKIMLSVAYANYCCNNFPEQLSWLERALKFCEENFVEDAPETLEVLKALVIFHNGYHDDQENFDVYVALADRDKEQEYQHRIDAAKAKNLGDLHTEVINAKKNSLRSCSGDIDDEIALRRELDELYRENFKLTSAKKSHWQLYDDYMENIELIIHHAEYKDNETYNEFYERLGIECKEYLQEMFRADDFDLETFAEAIHGQESPLDSFLVHTAYHYEIEARKLLAFEFVNFCRLENVRSAKSIDILLDLADFCYQNYCEDEASEAYRRIYEIVRELSRRDPDFKYNFDLDFYKRWADKEKVDNLRGKLLDRHRRFIEENRAKLGENNFWIIDHMEEAAKLLDALGRHEEAFKTRHRATILRASNPNVRSPKNVNFDPAEKILAEIYCGTSTGGLSARQLAELFEEKGNREQALIWWRKELETLENRNSETAAEIYIKLGDYAQAAQIYRPRYIDIYFSGNIKDAQKAAALYDRLGDTDNARKIREEIAAAQEKIWQLRLERFGAEDSFTLAAKKNLDNTLRLLKD